MLSSFVRSLVLLHETEHKDPTSQAGIVSEFHSGLVREPVFIPEAMKIPEAKVAIHKEWNAPEYFLDAPNCIESGSRER